MPRPYNLFNNETIETEIAKAISKNIETTKISYRPTLTR